MQSPSPGFEKEANSTLSESAVEIIEGFEGLQSNRNDDDVDYTAVSCAAFSENYLQDVSSMPKNWMDRPFVRNNVDVISNAKSTLAIMSDAACKLLNELSELVCLELSKFGDNVDISQKVVFWDTHDKPLRGLDKARVRPAIICIHENHLLDDETYPEYYGHQALSIIEVSDDVKAFPVIEEYMRHISYAKHDFLGGLGLSVKHGGFGIIWSDCQGSVGSVFSFDNGGLLALFQYICTLYLPKVEFPQLDSTIQRCTPFLPAQPKWKVQVGEEWIEGYYVFSYGGYGRQTRILRGEDNIVIKDQMRVPGQRGHEGQMYEALGSAPGFARYACDFAVKVDLGTGKHDLTTGIPTFRYSVHGGKPLSRVKSRLVMLTYGELLTNAKSLLHLLEIMYDVVEALRYATLKKVLHQDVSIFNILINPSECASWFRCKRSNISSPICRHGECKADPATAFDGHKFIRTVLGDATARSCAALVDLDNSTKLEHRVVQNRSGTPMFVSTAAARCEFRTDPENVNCPSFPKLHGEALNKYTAAYSEDEYNRFNRIMDASDGKLPSTLAPPFVYHPYHDLESLFWILAYRLLASYPKGGDQESTLIYSQFMSQFIGHTFRHSDFDSRLVIRPGMWKKILHTALQPAATLLMHLQTYIQVEWALSPETWDIEGPTVVHAHEAFRRLLLLEICRIKREGDVELEQSSFRATSGSVVDHPIQDVTRVGWCQEPMRRLVDGIQSQDLTIH